VNNKSFGLTQQESNLGLPNTNAHREKIVRMKESNFLPMTTILFFSCWVLTKSFKKMNMLLWAIF